MTTYEREGRVYVRPLGRGTHFIDGDEAYLDDIMERLVGGSGYGYLRLHIDFEPDEPAPVDGGE